MTRKIAGVLILAALFGAIAAPAFQSADDSISQLQFSGPTMGTRYNYSLFGCRVSPDVQAAVDELLAKINQQMSTYDPRSELSQFNASVSTEWIDVSPDTAKVVTYALKVAKDSNGWFDPTVGPVVNLWGFGPDGRRRSPPTDAEVADALVKIGYDKIEARLDPPALRKHDPAVYLDLSAVAKGYASDAVADLLVEQGFAECMVEIGGEVATRGKKRNGDPWRIGLQQPDAIVGEVESVVSLAGEAVATSGDYRNFFEVDGVRFSHTIDPTTGRPATHRLATVTVRASRCMEADALATTLLVMGPKRGYDWASEQGVAALFIERHDDAYRQQATPAWKQSDEPAS